MSEADELRQKIAEMRLKIEKIVCTDEIDRGVILLSSESATHYDKESKCLVYDDEYFSELGRAMVELWKMT